MDINLYYEILRWREEDPHKIATSSSPPQQLGISVFHQDILLRKAVWTNNKRKDFKYWLQSFHPLIGFLYAPKHHVYSAKYRLADLCITLSIGSLWSAFACYYTNLLLNIQFIGTTYYYSKLLLIALLNCILLYLVEHMMTNCCTKCFQFIRQIPSCVLITIAVISVLGGIVIAVELDDTMIVQMERMTARFGFLFCFTFLLLWILQLIVCYISFAKRWKSDQQLIRALDDLGSHTDENNDSRYTMLSASHKNPYYVTFNDFSEYMLQRGECNVDLSVSGDNMIHDRFSNDLVQGYTPPNATEDDSL